jgi:hypothetical protein
MTDFNPLDDAGDLVGGRIDEVNIVPSGIGLP